MAQGRPSDHRVDLLFDARHIRQSGIGTYIRTQLPHLEASAARHHRTLAVLVDDDTAPHLSSDTRVVSASPASAGMYSPAEQLVWRHAFAGVRPRAVWLPHYPYPLARLLPGNRRMLTYLTVHDTIHLLPPEVGGQGPARRLYARAMLAADARSARRNFTVSEATAATLRQVTKSAPTMVTPIPVDDVWFDPVDAALCPVAGRYVLYVGNTKRHKNLPLLIEAFTDVAGQVPHKLVIAGGGASLRTLDDRVREMAEDNDRVVLTGQLDFLVLRALVAAADLLVMPSLYEGAGLPPLEAMASRTAVLASNVPAVRETCGEGAEFFDPHDRGALAALLRTYCTDDAARAQLAQRGHDWVITRQKGIDPAAAAETIFADLS